MNTTHAMTGRRAVITGPTSGIGKVAAIELARADADLILVCRNAAKAQALLSELAPGDHRIVIADFQVLDDVRRAADEIIAMNHPVHVLLNNAGLVALGRTTTPDNLEMTFAVNHLAPFLLTNLLLDLLASSAPARIVNVASDAHRFTGGRLDFDNLQGEKSYKTMRHYGATKLCNLLFTHELARRLQGRNVTVNALHPGMVGTGLGTDNGLIARLAMSLIRPFSRSPERGAESSIYLCSAPEVAQENGGYYFDCKPYKAAAYANNADDAALLWATSCELTGLAAN
jgi:NAD(P)-dependent dehydrogenase (short-subunit alcohol dehydrogenase family)